MSPHKVVVPNIHLAHTNPKIKHMWSKHGGVIHFIQCLYSLPIYRDDVIAIPDDGQLVDRIPIRPTRAGIYYTDFFLLDDELFMVQINDDPYLAWEEWTEHYKKAGVRGFFVTNRRFSYEEELQKCGVPILTIIGMPDIRSGPIKEWETNAHSLAMTTEHDISVFFSGKFKRRIIRLLIAAGLQDRVDAVFIVDNKDPNRTGIMSSKEYMHTMARSKIVWCPRSIVSYPDGKCHSVTAKEYEAMIMEKLVLKEAICQFETEPRESGIHFVEYNSNGSDIVEIVEYYLAHEDERREIAHNGRLWWERNGSTPARACHIYDSALQVLYPT